MERSPPLVMVLLVLVVIASCCGPIGAQLFRRPEAKRLPLNSRWGSTPLARSASHSLRRRQLTNASPEESSTNDLACIVSAFGPGECRSIAAECEQAQCPENTVCGLDHDENITCFDASVKSFENCGSEEFRLQQPCPADAGIKGFGMGCTFCAGGFPFGGAPPTLSHVSHMCLFNVIMLYLFL